jgi:hypothetical protein
MKRLILCACLALSVMAGGCEVKADLKPLKIKEVKVGLAGATQSQTNTLQAAITGEFLERGAVMDPNGVSINVVAEMTGTSTTAFKLTAQAIDATGVSLSVSYEQPGGALNSFQRNAEIAAYQVANRVATQIVAQMDKGRRPAGAGAVIAPDPPNGVPTSSVTAGK